MATPDPALQRFTLERQDLDKLRDVMLRLASGRYIDAEQMSVLAQTIELVLRRADEVRPEEPARPSYTPYRRDY